MQHERHLSRVSSASTLSDSSTTSSDVSIELVEEVPHKIEFYKQSDDEQTIVWQDTEEVKTTRTLPIVAMHGINGIVGAGVLSLPFAFAKCGIIGGLLCLCIVGVLGYATSLMMIDSVRLYGRKEGTFPSYADVARSFNKAGAIAAPVSALLFRCVGN
ncbi:MAG: hypothetical protein MHM6MM_006311 [Cercozoa sp. M6MM]